MTETSSMFNPTVTREENHVRSATAKEFTKSPNSAEFSLHLRDGYEIEYLWIPTVGVDGMEGHITQAVNIKLNAAHTLGLTIFGTAAQLQDFARAISSAVAAGWAEANPKPVFVEHDPKTEDVVRAIVLAQPDEFRAMVAEESENDTRGPLVLQAIDGVPTNG